MSIKYFATNRQLDDLAGLVHEKTVTASRERQQTLQRGGYYFVEMDAYMAAYLETTRQEVMPAHAVVANSAKDVFDGFLGGDKVDRILVCVHGFNVELSGALDWYGVLVKTMQNAGAPLATRPEELKGEGKKTAVIGFSWPSNGRVIDYLSDQRDAQGSTSAFGNLLVRLAMTGKPVSLICHSMGNYMAGYALQALVTQSHMPPALASAILDPSHAAHDRARTIQESLKKAAAGEALAAGEHLVDTMVMLAPDVERRHIARCTDAAGAESYVGPFYYGVERLVGKAVNVFSRYDGALGFSNLEKGAREGAMGAVSAVTFGLINYSKRNPDLRWEQRLGLGPHPANAPSNMMSLNAAELARRPVDHGDHVDSPAIAAAIASEVFGRPFTV